MKILRFERKITDMLPPLTEVPGGGVPMGIIADSAVNRNRHPVFIPDFAREDWTVEILPAIQISRLGKFIAPRFAHRYISGLTLCALLRPAVPSGETDSLFFDCALTVGDILPYNSEGTLTVEVEYAPLKNAAGETSRRELTLAPGTLDAGELIARASVYTTLKSGDLILPGSLGLTFPTTINRALSATINSLPTLSTRIK